MAGQSIDLAEAATLYQISTHTLRNYIRSQKLTQQGQGKSVRLDRDELAALFAPKIVPATRRVFAICNHKGGVAKTTTAGALGWFLSRRAQTLMIDADPQGHLTQVCGLDSDGLERTLYEVMVKGLPIHEAIQPIILREPPLEFEPNSLKILGSNLELAETTMQVTGRPWWAKILRNALKPVMN
jgi:hypothetical protein